MTSAEPRPDGPFDDEPDVVDDLLAEYFRADRDTPHGGSATDDDFGPYRLIEQLGEGGMGQVFLAEQVQPVQRRVALKILRTSLDSRTLLLRFHAERQALARMNHDHIARVFDAGESRAGRPFFVMEYVPGRPVTAYCDEHRVDLDARLRLFAAICDGVQHAHDNGVLHRDLKPGNVLVVAQGERPTPKIIDFGLARLLDVTAEERAGYSRHGAVLGTPDYMSPEQARGIADLGPGTDVYSLGVVLHEMITGVRPFAASDTAVSIPSSRLVAMGPTAAAVAACRGTDQGRLVRRVRGDLDWIVLRALHAEPERRYPSAAALGADVRAFLDARPVAATATPLADRLRRWGRRHPALAGGLVGGLVIGTGVFATLVAWSWFAPLPTPLAEVDGMVAVGNDESLLGGRIVADTISDLVDPDRLTSMPSEAQRSLLLLALEVNGKRVAAARGNTVVAAEVAVAQVEIGIALQQLGRPDEAAAALQTAQSMLAALLLTSPDRLDLRGHRGRAEDAIGRLARDRGDTAAAVASGRAAVEDLRAAMEGAAGAELASALGAALGSLVDALYTVGQYAAALATSGEQIALLERLGRTTDTAAGLDEMLRARYSRGLALNGMRQYKNTRDVLLAAIAFAEARAAQRPLDRDERYLLASTRRLSARLLQRLAGNRDEGPAGAMAQRALADFRDLAREFANAPDYLHGAASSLFLLAEFRRHTGDHAAASPLYDEGLQLVLRALDAVPKNSLYLATAAAFVQFGSSSRLQLGAYEEVADAVLQLQARLPALTYCAAQVLAELSGILASRPTAEERQAAEVAAGKAVELLARWASGRNDAAQRLIWAAGLDALRSRADFNSLTKDPAARADDRESTLPIAASWCTDQTADQLAQHQREGWRIVDFELESLAPRRFAATLVRNEGAYERATRWLADASATDLEACRESATPIVVDAAMLASSGEWRAAVLLGAPNPTGWIWRPATNTAGTRALAKAHWARPVSVSLTLDQMPARLTVVFTGNHQWDFREWRFERADAAAVQRDHDAGWSVTDLTRLADDSLRCIAVRTQVAGQRVDFGRTAGEVQARLTAEGLRVVAFCTYERDGRRLYDVVMNPNRPR